MEEGSAGRKLKALQKMRSKYDMGKFITNNFKQYLGKFCSCLLGSDDRNKV